MSVNLCFVTDDYYAMPTCITINSILKSKNKNTIYNVYILCKDISDYKRKKFMELNTETLEIKIIDINKEEDFSDFKIEGIPATPTAMYKFLIPDILNKLDRIIYLDGDIIVQEDLEELYNCNIGDNYIGAVKDTNGIDYDFFGKKIYKYFNSGVMIMNLEKMRRDKISKKLLEYRKCGYNKLMDQDTFNFVVKDAVTLLPFKFNTQMNTLSGKLIKNHNYNIKNFKKYWNITEEYTEISDVFKDAVILHYTTAKPWKFYDGYGNDEWFKNYIESPYGKEKLYRKSYYVDKIVNSTTFKIAKRISYPISFFKKNFSNRKYRKFLIKFLYKQ